MQSIKDQLAKVVESGQLAPIVTTKPSLSAKQKLKLADTWQILLSRRLVTDPVGSDAYRVFEVDMGDLTASDLDRGLLKSRDAAAFPNRWFSTPAFRELCKATPGDYGLTDARTAMNEYCAAPYPKGGQQYSHEAVYLAGEAVGSRNMEHLTEKELLPLFEQAYDVLVKRVMSGEDLRRYIPKALPAKVVVVGTPDSPEYQAFQATKRSWGW